MVLEPGARFGSYEIATRLGAGGMGEVWRARDAQLGRDVALKLVGEAFGDDPERRARFEREAKLLAACHHPNIAVLYGQEEFEGRRALVLELVEGPTLAERLAAGAIPPQEALAIARQVAEALAHAHAHGIIHRDLKPANIKLTPEGQVKVLDFGLGRPVAAEPGTDVDLLSSPTLSRPGTRAGVILGTAPYMSPEQARGQAVDRRSDIWSFGVILFEMLTGARLFRGGDHLGRARVRAADRGRVGSASRRDAARGAPAPAPLPGARSPRAAARLRGRPDRDRGGAPRARGPAAHGGHRAELLACARPMGDRRRGARGGGSARARARHEAAARPDSGSRASSFACSPAR